jgi:hypothetical protein
VYTSRPSEFRMVEVERARDHAHVEILVGRGGETGKNAVITEDKAKRHARAVLTDLLNVLGREAGTKHVLVATHKDGEAAFRTSPLAKRFASLETCHWNAITGENAWGACDVGVVATLPYLPLPADLSTFMAAHQRELDDAQLNGDQELKELKLVRAMRMAQEVTQFIGRLQRETAVAPVTIFLRLPDHQQQIEPDQFLGLVTETLHGARTREWAGATRKTPRPGRGQGERQALAGAVEGFLAGERRAMIPATEVCAAVGTSTSSWGRFLQATERIAGFAVIRPETPGMGRGTVFQRQ